MSFLAGGCATARRTGSAWGSNAGFLVDGDHLKRSLLGAALDPRTWVPAVGAVLFSIDDWDDKTSDWARDERPLFGSGSSARTASDVFLGVLGVEALATLILIPTNEESASVESAKSGELSFLPPRFRGILVEALAFGATTSVVEGLKQTVTRRRPDSNFVESSFPSGHTSEAFAFATLSSRNLKAMGVAPKTRGWIEAGNTAVAGLTGWARVEAGKHFPKDILAGAAIGHFVTAFVHDTFMRESLGDEPIVEFTVEKGRAMFGVVLRF